MEMADTDFQDCGDSQVGMKWLLLSTVSVVRAHCEAKRL